MMPPDTRNPRNPARRSRRLRTAVLLGAILVIAAAVRVYRLRDVPAGLFCDEAALGYNAYSILKTGMDEQGVRFPLYVWSFGGYKNPVYIYTAIAPIAMLGLDEFSLRLTSVFYGLVTIAGLYLLVAEITDRRGGLIAAFLLAISYWHIHFSRIAFELISLPAFFVLGFYFLVRGVRRGTNWCWWLSALLFGACFYAYAPSKLQVPIFLLGASIVYLKEIWRRKAAFLLALVLFAAVVFPALHFSYRNKARAQKYFTTTSIFRRESDPKKLAAVFWKNYRTFFGREFLFERVRDPAQRHGVKNFGVYPRFFLPLAVLGLFFIPVKRNRSMFLVLIWAALFPAAASLMNQIPSASRSFFGAPVLPVICGYGLYCLMALTDRIGRRWIAHGISAAIVAALGFFSVRDMLPYLDEYFNRFSKYTSGGIYAFQYGYRDVIGYMESRRDDYDQLMLTATGVNQPYIFALFYSGMDPERYIKTRDRGYLILTPREYKRYSVKKTLYSLREEDLKYFSDYDVRKVVQSPDGVVQFVIADVRGRKNYITNWMTAGLFDNRGRRGEDADFIDVDRFSLSDSYPGRYGKVTWRQMNNQFIELDFNRFYARQPNDRHRGNPEEVCAYALTYVDSPTARDAALELSGSPDRYGVWLNGEPVDLNGSLSSRKDVRKHAIALDEGENELLIKTCEGAGDWFLLARLVSPEGGEFSDIEYRLHGRRPVGKPASEKKPTPEKAGGDRARPTGEADAVLVEGFSDIISHAHTKEKYPDIRGGAEGWWEYYRGGGEEISWETAACPEKKDTVFVFFGQTGEEEGEAELFVNGRLALAFKTGLKGGGEWAGDGFRLVKRPAGYSAGNCGLYYLLVPAREIEAGRPCQITVSHHDGGRVSWFMIKGYRDNIAREAVTPDSLPPVLLEQRKE